MDVSFMPATYGSETQVHFVSSFLDYLCFETMYNVLLGTAFQPSSGRSQVLCFGF